MKVTTHSPHRMAAPAVALAILALAAGADAQTVSAGRVLAVAGEASLARAGQRLPLQTGSLVESGDVLEVGDKSTLQVRFTDESVVALRANSQFRIEDYRYDKSADSDRSILGLLKGGMRTITGLIGKANQNNYAVRTATSTIGIRGTHFTVVSCNNDCRNPDGTQGLNGTFGGVTDGRIQVSNDSGKQEFSQQDYFYVASATAPPVRLLAPPAILSDRGLVIGNRKPAATTPTETTEAKADAESVSKNGSGTQTSTSPQLTVQAAPSTQLTAPLTRVASTDQPKVVASASNLIAVVEVRSVFPSGIEANSQIYGVSELRAKVDELPGTRFTDSASLAAELQTIAASKGFQLGASAAAAAYWIYEPPNAGSNSLLGNHHAFGDPPTVALPGSGTAQYNYVGGTTPTDNFGRVGSFSGGNGLLMDFAARQIKPMTNLTLSFGTNAQQATPTVYLLPSSATFSMSAGPQVWAGATCTSGCVGTTTGTVNGLFVGAAAQGFISAVTVSNTQLNTSKPNVAGAVSVFARQ